MSYSPLELPCIRAVVGPGRLGPLRLHLNPSHGRAHVRIGSTALRARSQCVLLARPHQVGRAARGRFLRWSRLAHAEAGSLAAHPRHALAQSHPRREGAGVCIRRARALCAVRAACRYGGCLHVLAFARGRMKAAGLRAGPSGAASTVPPSECASASKASGLPLCLSARGQSGLECRASRRTPAPAAVRLQASQLEWRAWNERTRAGGRSGWREWGGGARRRRDKTTRRWSAYF